MQESRATAGLQRLFNQGALTSPQRNLVMDAFSLAVNILSVLAVSLLVIVLDGHGEGSHVAA